jgi:hypothetical protein
MSSITMKPKWTITRESEEHITHREARSLSNTWKKDKKGRLHWFFCLCLLTQPKWLSPFSLCCSLCDSKGHRVDRVLGFFSNRPNCDSPTPSHAGECVPPLFGSGGDTLACGRAGWEWGVPIRTRRQTLWNSRFICALWVVSITFFYF